VSRRFTAARRAALAGVVAAGVAAAAPLSLAAGTPKPKPPRPPRPPLATTAGPIDVSDTAAALTGTVNPRGLETTYYFQYGPTATYGGQTPTVAAGAGTASVRVSQPVAGLQLGTLYHYRLVAVSSAGPADGQDRTFTTKQVPLRFVLARATVPDVFGTPFTVTGTLTGTGGAGRQVVLQANPFPYLGAFTDLGAPQTTNAGGGFAFRVPSITQTTELRVRTLDPVPTYSAAVTEHVAVAVTLRARPTGTRGVVRLEGTVAPAEPGAQVAFQRLRSVRGPAGAGATVARGRGRRSRFSAVVLIRHSGQYRALVRVTNGRQVTGSSRAVYLRGGPRPPRRARRH
jgi:hypothetical protein